MPIKKITRIALLSAVLYVAKVALEFLPNVELVSFLIIIYTLVFGAETFIIITVFNMFELIQWGFGIWWVSYLYVWPLLCLFVLLLKRFLGEEFVLWAIASGVFGLIFGSLFAIAYLPVDHSYALAYWISGLTWDVWHGICNFLIMLLIGKPVYQVMMIAKKKDDS
ncbi:hypothetical protein [Kineothrix sp. MB12-C1]|uniref:hypothetical protein n=1 Tax=Kineothrix sp. MB12-C1 TaxID=3070215 RepID=UPI0027D2AF9D|nr:hypothetical protein [Kineothrix sp. MB12-C1]WMC91149.1 hypothetical protein RBB56_09640 [Kineothrix sp. MB12-C1]